MYGSTFWLAHVLECECHQHKHQLEPIQLVIFALSVYAWKTPNYADSEFYPTWAHSVGWFLMLFVTMQIPAVAVIMVILYAVRGKARAVVSRDRMREAPF